MSISAYRSRLVWSPLLGWALLSCVPGAQAQISVTTPVGTYGGATSGPTTSVGPAVVVPSTGDAPVSGGGTTVVSGAAPGVVLDTAPVVAGQGEELGIAVGAFRLFPAIEINLSRDDNVFAQKQSDGTTASLYTKVEPSLSLRSEWLNHSLNFLVSGGFANYFNAPTQNYRNFTIATDGRLDILSDLAVTGAISFKRATEAVGTPNVAISQEPTVADSIPIQIGLKQTFNRVFYEFTGKATQYTYTDHSVVSSASLSAEDRARWEYEETLKIGYEITEDVSLYIAPGLNQRRYRNPVNSLGQSRDSTGQTFGFGTAIKVSEINTIDGFVGYTTQQSGGSLGSTSAYTFGLSGTWNGYAPLTLRPSFNRGISESSASGFRNIISTTMALDASYQIFDSWTAIGSLSYNSAQYVPIEGSTTATARTDSYYRASLGFLYTLRPQVQIGPVYEYSTGSSTDPTNGADFTRQTFSVRLIAKR